MQRNCIIATSIGITGIVIGGAYSIYSYYENLELKRKIWILEINENNDKFLRLDETNTLEVGSDIVPTVTVFQEDFLSPATAIRANNIDKSKYLYPCVCESTKNMWFIVLGMNIVNLTSCAYIYYRTK